MTTPTVPDVPLPNRAVYAAAWEPENYRIFEGERRHIDNTIHVWTHGLQYCDGTIDDGTKREAPGISVAGLNEDISAETARRLADLLVTASDELDLWTHPSAYPVASATKLCCRGIGRHTPNCPDRHLTPHR